LPRIQIEVNQPDLDYIEKFANIMKRSRKAQIEMIITDWLAEDRVKGR